MARQHTRPTRRGALIALALVGLLSWCGCGAPLPTATTAPPATPTVTTVPVPTATILPTPTAMPLETADQSTQRLVAARVNALPEIDGQLEPLWGNAPALVIPLQWGIDGAAHALDVTMRALYTEEAIAFCITWRDDPPSGQPNEVQNKLVVHWPLPEPEHGPDLNCMVACHTAFADGQGRFAYVAPETIPTGASASLPMGGGWDGDSWTLEWSRPLVNGNPYDLQFTPLTRPYRFFVKVFEHVESQPDPISEWVALAFAGA